MIPQPPPGQGPIEPRNAFAAPPTGGQAPYAYWPSSPVPAPGFQHHASRGYPAPMPPAPGMMPTPFFGLPPQPPHRGGVGRAIVLTLLILGLFLSLFVNFVVLLGVGDADGTAQFTVSAGANDQKVAVVPLRGVIEANASMQFDQFIDIIEKDAGVKALVVEIDSPGGTVTASDEIYERLRRFKASRNIPIVVTMGSMAASGGYYVACGADYIFAQPMTITANIGVISPRFNFSKLMEKYGVDETTIVATGSTYKNAGSSFSPETADARAYWQDLIDQAYKRFVTVVQQGRGSRLTGNMADIANGKAYVADQAMALGLVDKIGYADDAYDYAAKSAKLGNPRVVKYERPMRFLERVLSSKSNAGPMGASVGAGGVNVNVDAALLEQLTTPRLLYLAR